MRVSMLADLAPDFLDGFMDMACRHFAVMQRKAIIGDMAQKRADAEGFGQEWREAVEAGNSPHQKGYLGKMVAVIMKADGLNQNQAIAQIAKQSGREAEDIRRTVTRSKNRAAK